MSRRCGRQTAGAAILAAAICLCAATAARADADIAQDIRAVPEGMIVTPGSSRPAAFGMAHTNIHGFAPHGAPLATALPGGKYETPASLACVYHLTPKVAGCNPQTLTAVATSGSRTIAIVDAYHYPTAAADLAAYSAQFGLPVVTATSLRVVFATGTQPPQDATGGWEVEEALDIEMAHAMAPNANIVLVEARSASWADLNFAEHIAIRLVAATGGEVSNSWGSGEFPGELTAGRTFADNHVVIFASAGDTPGVEWPSALPNVVAVGGTSIIRDVSGNYLHQNAWRLSGGGKSAYVATPSYQSGVTAVVGRSRGVPDVAMVADPNSGVWVYDTTPYNGQVLRWSVWGGTSVAAPAMAGLVNSAGEFQKSTLAELIKIYSDLGVKSKFTDIRYGACANAAGATTLIGYDLCTGIGTPFGIGGK